jgi:hypothetical protein
VEPRARTTGTVYRDEAAELMAAAARRSAGPQQQETTASYSRKPAAPFVRPESRRPLPYPEPVGVNDNPDEYVTEAPRRRISIPRLLARILIAPLYLAVAFAALGIIGLFAKSYFGI